MRKDERTITFKTSELCHIVTLMEENADKGWCLGRRDYWDIHHYNIALKIERAFNEG